MEIFEIIISLIIIIGIGLILYLILRDPILMFKSLLRGIKGDDNLKIKIIFSPIWVPIWLIDRLFKLKLYINDFEDASQPKDIKFTDYDKYIQVDTEDIVFIEKILKSFNSEYDPKDYNYSLNGAVVKLTKQDVFTLVKIEREIDFNSFNALIHYISNSAPQNRIFHAKGILINRRNRADSYFCFVDIAFSLKLIGKTYRNKKMYVGFDTENTGCEKIFLNSNIEYFKNFNFDKFDSDVMKLRFSNVEIKPSTQHAVYFTPHILAD